MAGQSSDESDLDDLGVEEELQRLQAALGIQYRKAGPPS